MVLVIYCGDCLEILRTLPTESVNCCVTSPPYYGLRDYGVSGQIGLEQSPEEYVAKLVDVFREVRRVLRDDGSFWLNLGDSYAANRGYQVPDNKHIDVGNSKGMNATSIGLKPKDLIGTPWRVAFALQADGWYLRQDIIWHKPNPMPESVKDRCTKAHEYVFLLSKSARYFYDCEAVREPIKQTSGLNFRARARTANGALGGDNKHHMESRVFTGVKGANRRSVWTIPTKPYKGAHFATFPPALVEPCILAGCPAGGTVIDPFFGSGTVGAVAVKHGRDFVGIELNPEYIALAEKRIRATQPPLMMAL
ncbi:MAG: site-specific DNA-methyltransferase [Bacilli bacterium]